MSINKMKYVIANIYEMGLKSSFGVFLMMN